MVEYTVTKNRNSIRNPGTQNTHEPILSSPAQGFVPEVGLEPTRLSTYDPKSYMATVTSLGHLIIRTFFLV